MAAGRLAAAESGWVAAGEAAVAGAVEVASGVGGIDSGGFCGLPIPCDCIAAMAPTHVSAAACTSTIAGGNLIPEL